MDFKWTREISVRNIVGWNRYYLSRKGRVIAYVDMTKEYKDYYAFVDCNPYNMSAHLLSKHKYLKDAKKAIEDYYGLKKQGKGRAEYGIKGELRPFGL